SGTVMSGAIVSGTIVMIVKSVVSFPHASTAVNVMVISYCEVAQTSSSALSKSWVTLGFGSQLSLTIRLAIKLSIIAAGSDVPLMSPQSRTISSGTVKSGEIVSGTMVIVVVT